MKFLFKKSHFALTAILVMSLNSISLANDSIEYNYTPTFSDVNQEQGELFGNIEYLAHIGVIQGYADGTFGRKEYINRAEMMKIVVEGLGYNPNEQDYRNCFPDVQTAWYAKYVCFAEKEGWIDGYADGYFRPDNKVTHAQAIKIIMNAFFAEEVNQQTEEEMLSATKEMKDVDVDDWYRPYIALSNTKILQNFNSNWAAPNFYMNRGRVADLFFKAMMVSEQEWEVYHKYFRDEFFKANDLAHFIVGQTDCYEFWPTFNVPYLWDYVSQKYGINDRPTRNADFYGSEGPDEFPYFDPGYFCPLRDGGMLFSNAITYDKQGAERHLMRFSGEGELLQDDGFECEEEDRDESIFYDDRDVVKAFKLEDIDPETFTLIGCRYAKDKDFVYRGVASNDSTVRDADVDTFEELNDYYGKDRNRVYYQGGWTIGEIDLETLEVLGNKHIRDKDHVYYEWEPIFNSLGEPADPNSFEVLSNEYGRDKNAVYFRNKGLPEHSDSLEIDPNTFEVLSETYARSDKFVFYRWDKLPESANPDTFQVIDKDYGKDNAEVYFKAYGIPRANPSTFELLQNNYGKDSQNVYHYTEIVEGANPEAFEFMGKGGLFGFARDEDQLFQSGNSMEEQFIEDAKEYKKWYPESDFEFKGFDSENFESIQNSNYYTDGNHVYHHSVTLNLMEEADPATFRVVEEYLPDPFASDKNHAYCQGQVISDDPYNFNYAEAAANCPIPPPPISVN